MIKIENIDIKIEHGGIITYITTTDDNETDRYILLQHHLLIGNEHYGYVIRHIWQNGIDAWGSDYACNKEDLYDIVKNNDNSHVFVDAIKAYIKKLEHDKTLILV